MDIQAIISLIEERLQRIVRMAYIATERPGVVVVYALSHDKYCKCFVTSDGRGMATDDWFDFPHLALEAMERDADSGCVFYEYIPIDERSYV